MPLARFWGDSNAARHPFYVKVNEVLEQHKVARRLEHLCRRFYKPVFGGPSLAPGVCFRMLLIGYFEGIDSERGIAWRVADSLSPREFVGCGMTEQTPDHSTVSRTRRLLPVETHKAVFRWFARVLGQEGLLQGQSIALDATTLEANAALRSIRRRENGRSYEEYLKDLPQAEGIESPTREQLARLDRKRKKKGSNREWKSPADSVTPQTADLGDTTTIHQTLQEAQAHTTLIDERGAEEVVAGKGYHSSQVLVDLHTEGVRGYIPEPDRRSRNSDGKEQEQKQVHRNRRRMRGRRGRDLQKLRSELMERNFAHMYETGAMQRTDLRKNNNILKRLLFHAIGFNLAVLLRERLRLGKPRTFRGSTLDPIFLLKTTFAFDFAGIPSLDRCDRALPYRL